MTVEWFYRVLGEEFGPVSSSELRRLAQSGTIDPDTQVREGKQGDWVLAERVKGLFDPAAHGSAVTQHVTVVHDPQEQQWGARPNALSPAQAGALGTVKAVAILNVVAGGLGLLWALLMLVETVAAATGMLPHEPGDPPLILMVFVFVVMFALALGGGVFVTYSGVKLLQRKRGARKLAFAAAIVNCAGMIWGCCVGVLTLPLGIYSLVVLSREDVKRFVD